ncbi:ROK family protein [Rhizobium leguminosarum]
MTRPVLAIDIGGTKTMTALVSDAEVLEEVTVPTQRSDGPDTWLTNAHAAAERWHGKYDAIGLAVTGFIRNGLWSAMNPETLGIPENYPLVDKTSALFGARALAMNDAQAAAWGEYRFGAGSGGDLVFLTVSTGVGGGIVINGRPLGGLAGHFGLMQSFGGSSTYLEDQVSGRWMQAEAARQGFGATPAPDIFNAARNDETWAKAIVARSARGIAMLCRDIQLTLDPAEIVIGGGVGLAEGYLDLVRDISIQAPSAIRSNIVPAKLAARAGVIGIADLASRLLLSNGQAK